MLKKPLSWLKALAFHLSISSRVFGAKLKALVLNGFLFNGIHIKSMLQYLEAVFNCKRFCYYYAYITKERLSGILLIKDRNFLKLYL